MTRSNVYKGRSSSYGGSGLFSFRVVGEVYQWWEKPFLGKHPAWFWGTVGGLGLILFLLFFFVIFCFVKCHKTTKGVIKLDQVIPLPEESIEPDQEKSMTAYEDNGHGRFETDFGKRAQQLHSDANELILQDYSA